MQNARKLGVHWGQIKFEGKLDDLLDLLTLVNLTDKSGYGGGGWKTFWRFFPNVGSLGFLRRWPRPNTALSNACAKIGQRAEFFEYGQKWNKPYQFLDWKKPKSNDWRQRKRRATWDWSPSFYNAIYYNPLEQWSNKSFLICGRNLFKVIKKII